MMNNYILEYYQAIKDGSIIAGRWIILLYENIVKGLEDKSFFYDAKKAHKAIKFIENFCHHSKGRNDLIKLELWQKALVSLIFGIVDSEGNRQFREVCLIVGRKNGKSLVASFIIATLCYAFSEFGGEVYCIAPKLDQANIIYNCFWETVTAEPELASMIKSRKNDYYIESTHTIIKKVAYNVRKSDGYNPNCVCADEFSSWRGDSGKKQYEVMKSALGARREPLLLSTSTASYDEGGLYDELVTRGTRYLLGDSKETRLLPVFYMIDDVEKWNSISELYKANPNLGISVSIDYMLEEIAVAEGSLSKKAEFLCKYCNIKQTSSSAFFSAKDVNKAVSEEITLDFLSHSYCTAGIDLSQAVDLTACSILVEKDGILYDYTHFWLPAEKLESAIARDGLPYREYIQRGWLSLSGTNFVDYNDVYQWFVELVDKYEILPLVVGYDRYSSQYLVKQMSEGTGYAGYEFRMSDVYQGYNLTPAINEFEGLVKDGKFKIGNNNLMKVHMINVAVQQDNESRRKKIVKISPSDHIDGVASVLDALIVREAFFDEYGEQLKNR